MVKYKMIDENQRNHFVFEGTEDKTKLVSDVLSYIYRKSRRRTKLYPNDLNHWNNMYDIIEAMQHSLEKNKGVVYAWFINGERSSGVRISEWKVESIPTNEYYFK